MSDKENILFEAAACGDSRKVKELIETDGKLANRQHAINGWTALHWAAKRNHAPIIEILLQHGADKAIKTTDGKLAEDLCSSQETAKLLGKGHIEVPEESTGDGGFVPSYLKHSQYPTYYKDDTPKPRPDQKENVQLPTSSHISGQMRHFEISQNKLPGETVLKARIANHAEQDFIEVELDNSQKTFRVLVELLCVELSVDPVAVIKVRKLPNTILRKDKDIARLKDYHEIELVLEQNTCLSPSKNYVHHQDQMQSAINGKLLY